MALAQRYLDQQHGQEVLAEFAGWVDGFDCWSVRCRPRALIEREQEQVVVVDGGDFFLRIDDATGHVTDTS